MRGRCYRAPVRHRGYWVLKDVARDSYVCTMAGYRDWRTALCVFDSEAEAEAEGYLGELGGPEEFVETMQRYGMQVPDWMRREPELPEAHEATLPGLRRVAEGIGVEWVAVNPPPVGSHPDPQRADVIALLPVEELGVPSYDIELPGMTVQI